MDLSTIPAQLIPWLAAQLGIAPSMLMFYITVALMIVRALGRYIPDDATGVLAVIRQVCNAVTLDISNRVTAGVSTADVAAAALKTQVADKPPVSDELNKEK